MKFYQRKLIIVEIFFSIYFLGLTICDIFYTAKYNSTFIKAELIWFYTIIPIQIIFIIIELSIILIFLITRKINFYNGLFKMQVTYHIIITCYSYLMLIIISDQLDRDKIINHSMLRHCLSNFFFLIFVMWPKGKMKMPLEFFFKIYKLSKEFNIKLNNDSLLKIDETLECCICLRPYQVGNNILMLKCDHFFHENCAINWFEQKLNCPICREIVLEQ